MKHLFIVNPLSFSKQSDVADIISKIGHCLEGCTDDYHIHVSRFPRDGVRFVRRYLEAAAGQTVRVYAVGSDGIVFDCINGMKDHANAQLAIVPYGGVYNDFLRAFGESPQILDAFRDIKTMATAGTIATDIMSLGHRRVINQCTLGLEALAFYRRFDLKRKHPGLIDIFGKSIYKLIAPMAIMDKRLYNYEYEITIDGKSYDGQYVGLHIANTGVYGGKLTPAPMAQPNDGWLDIVFMRSVSRARLVGVVAKYTSGRYYTTKEKSKGGIYLGGTLRHIRGKQITVRSQHPMFINADSETHHDTNLTVTVMPGHMQIVVPDGLKYVRRPSHD